MLAPEKVCSVDGCGGRALGSGYCNMHYLRVKKTGEVGPVGSLRPRRPTQGCSVTGCSRQYRARGFCSLHYARSRSAGAPGPADSKRLPKWCVVDGCPSRSHAHGYCHRHLERVKKYGDPGGLERRSTGSPRRPEGTVTTQGYRVVWHEDKQVLQHRLIMSQLLGRPLRRNELVHHRNGNRLDNRIENLELCVLRQPPGQRVADLVGWARELLNIYGEEFPA